MTLTALAKHVAVDPRAMARWPQVAWLVSTQMLELQQHIDQVSQPYWLTLDDQRCILQTTQARHRPIGVDWLAKMSHWHQLPRRHHLLATALSRAGVHPDQVIVDATAGFGHDALSLLAIGCQVIAIERHPLVWVLLVTSYELACQQSTIFAKLKGQIIHQEAADWIQSTSEKIDTVFIDVMYPPSRTKALNQRRMRVLRAMVGHDEDAKVLIGVARRVARRQVVVKRPKDASPMTSQAPDAVVALGGSTRCDIYYAHASFV